MEIRVYYECYEQATNFIPLKSISEEHSIKYIQKRSQRRDKNGKFSTKYSNNINNVLSQKNPDLLISIIKNNVEVPVFVIEFSTAVFTKDHELQRADNITVCHDSNCFYVKVSPSKKNSAKAGVSFGGDTKFSYLEPYALLFQKKGDVAFHIDWKVSIDDSSKLIKHEKYLSLPNPSSLWEKIFTEVITFLDHELNIDKDWRLRCIRKFKDPSIVDWVSKLKHHEISEDVKLFNSSRTKWIANCEIFDRDYLEIKFRMGHAMDPSRGMMTYYSFFHLCREKVLSKFVIDPSQKSWYASTSNEEKISNLLKEKKYISKEEAFKCFLWGLNFPNKDELLNIFNQSDDEHIDLESFIKTKYNSLNISIRTLVKYSFATKLECKGFNLYIKYGDNYSDEYQTNLQITDLTTSQKLNEDLTTFSVIHNTSFFKGKNIISVSYPGAQADIVILPETEKGRRQIRPTIDIIAYDKENIYLCEVKDSINKINSDKNKLEKFYDDLSYQIATKRLIKTFDKGEKKIKLCLVFVCQSKEKLNTWINATNLSKIDFLCVFIEDTQQFLEITKEKKEIEKFKFPKSLVTDRF